MKKPAEKLISASTILILSGFLIGLTVGKIVSESLSPYVLACGLAGFLAFIALEFTGTQREEQSAHEEQTLIQGRLDRHVLSQSSVSFTLSSESLTSSPLDYDKPTHPQNGVDLKMLDELYEKLMSIDGNSDSVVLRTKSSIQA